MYKHLPIVIFFNFLYLTAHSQNPELKSVAPVYLSPLFQSEVHISNYKGFVYVVFRDGTSATGGNNHADGKIRIIRTKNGKKWEKVAFTFKVGWDLHDPVIGMASNKRLSIICRGDKYDKKGVAESRHFIFHSDDGVIFTDAEEISVEGVPSSDLIISGFTHLNENALVLFGNKREGWTKLSTLNSSFQSLNDEETVVKTFDQGKVIFSGEPEALRVQQYLNGACKESDITWDEGQGFAVAKDRATKVPENSFAVGAGLENRVILDGSDPSQGIAVSSTTVDWSVKLSAEANNPDFSFLEVKNNVYVAYCSQKKNASGVYLARLKMN